MGYDETLKIIVRERNMTSKYIIYVYNTSQLLLARFQTSTVDYEHCKLCTFNETRNFNFNEARPGMFPEFLPIPKNQLLEYEKKNTKDYLEAGNHFANFHF